jgi:hypothetical protein
MRRPAEAIKSRHVLNFLRHTDIPTKFSAKYNQTENSFEERLDRIENSLEELTKAVGTIHQLLAANLQQSGKMMARSSQSVGNSSPYVNAIFGAESPPFEDPSQTLSSFSKTASDLESLNSQVRSMANHVEGTDSLRDLSDALNTVHLQSDKIRDEAKKASRSENLFYIPNKEEGAWLMESGLF